MTGLPPHLAALSKRATKFKRKPDELKASLELLSERDKFLAKSATDYLATIVTGVAGFYVCRSEEQLPLDFCQRQRNADGKVTEVTQAGIDTYFYPFFP